MSESLRVTSCRVFLNEKEDDRLKGFASIILNDQFAVCDLKIIRGDRGLFVAFPSRRRRDGTFHDVAHPIVPRLRQHIEEIVLAKYDRVLDGEESGMPKDDLPPRWGAHQDQPASRRLDDGDKILRAFQDPDRQPYGSGDPIFDVGARKH